VKIKVERFDIFKCRGAFGKGSAEELQRFKEEAQMRSSSTLK
jgi:hypothetical protein